MPQLRKQLIRLAHRRPELRNNLLPLLSRTARPEAVKDIPKTEAQAWKDGLKRHKGERGPGDIKFGQKVRHDGKEWLVYDFDAEAKAPGGATMVLVSPDYKKTVRGVPMPQAGKTAQRGIDRDDPQYKNKVLIQKALAKARKGIDHIGGVPSILRKVNIQQRDRYGMDYWQEAMRLCDDASYEEAPVEEAIKAVELLAKHFEPESLAPLSQQSLPDWAKAASSKRAARSFEWGELIQPAYEQFIKSTVWTMVSVLSSEGFDVVKQGNLGAVMLPRRPQDTGQYVSFFFPAAPQWKPKGKLHFTCTIKGYTSGAYVSEAVDLTTSSANLAYDVLESREFKRATTLP